MKHTKHKKEQKTNNYGSNWLSVWGAHCTTRSMSASTRYLNVAYLESRAKMATDMAHVVFTATLHA